MFPALPLHPLVVHFAVVLVPLAFIALVAVVAVKRWREHYAIPAVGLSIAAALFSFFAYESGEKLAEAAGGAPSAYVY